MRNLPLLTIVLFLSLHCNSQTFNKIDWVTDIDFLAKELPQKHYDFFTVKDKKEFLEGLDKIKLSSTELTDIEVAIKLQQLIAGFGDSHTMVNYGQLIDKNKILPLHLYWFSDGLYILHTTEENNEILGHQILSVNGVPLKTITDSLSTLTTKDNQAIIRNTIPKLLPLVQVMECFTNQIRWHFAIEGKSFQLPNSGIRVNYSTKYFKRTDENVSTISPDIKLEPGFSDFVSGIDPAYEWIKKQ